MHRTIAMAVGLMVVLALPAGAVAKPTKQDKRNAAQECKLLRGTTDESREAFKASYRNLGACVSEKTREQARERRQAKRSASVDCRDERKQDSAAFAGHYRNFGKCVSSKARKELAAEDAADRAEIAETKNAAKECGAERDSIGDEPFAEKYGTNHNKRNAFGKCVSGKTAGDEPEDGGESDEEAPAS
jgi:hypothetical protein